MSHTTRSAWLGLLGDRRTVFGQLGHTIPTDISNESALSSHIEQLCYKHGDRYPTHSLVKLQNHAIDSFTSAIDTLVGLKPPSTLTGLAYGAIFVVIQVGLTPLGTAIFPSLGLNWSEPN